MSQSISCPPYVAILRRSDPSTKLAQTYYIGAAILARTVNGAIIISESNKNEERLFAFVFISQLPLGPDFADVASRANETKWSVTSSEQCFPPGEIPIDRNPSRPGQAPITIVMRPVSSIN
jgi:hypothetical protein